MSNLYVYDVKNSKRDLQMTRKDLLCISLGCFHSVNNKSISDKVNGIIQSSCRISLDVGTGADSLRGLAQAGEAISQSASES
jgi:hypothetical protein